MVSTDPCLTCGACCASFRVSFDSSQLDCEIGGYVPEGLAQRESEHLCRMRGTDYNPPRCAALQGKIGEKVFCAIYEFRPDPCREFAQHGSFGVLNAACNSARARHGLPALTSQ